ncbi:MAG TPA: hypothetical protein VEB66_13970 [Opitutaceae bacterium]|nr:hypothetical protein [Opitutaceae bacterium]
MLRRVLLAAFAYMVVTFAIAVPWHLLVFKELYDSFGLYNRAVPLASLGVLSMAVQGLVLAVVYARWQRGGHPVAEGVKFGLLFGAFLYSVSTLANVAKMNVDHAGTFFAVQALFHFLQFALAGAAVGLVFGRRVESAA